MKKMFVGFLVCSLFVVSWSAGALAFDMPLGDSGKPADYEGTIRDFGKMIYGFENYVDELPGAFDWRDLGMVTPAKDQGACGSCWAFASVGAIESKILMAFGTEYDLSEQQQVSCNASMHGCGGGGMTALKFWYDIGPLQESCTKYSAYDSSCDDYDQCDELSYHTKGYYTVNTDSISDIKTSLYDDGPTYFRFDVYEDFSTFWNTYNPGRVYVQSSGSLRGGHAVLIIGWDDSKNAWLCKNSWGQTAGPNGDGTFWIAYSGHTNDLSFGMANVSITFDPPTPKLFDVGTFQPWKGYGIQYGTWQSTDLNGDGKGDLVHLVKSDYVHTWISNGDGSFTVGSFQPWKGYGIQNGTWQSTDLNGDGKGDLVHLVNSDYVHTWISNGDGSFTVGTFKPWQGYGIQNGTWQNADLNGDGRGDLVHLVNSDYVHTWISNGDGSFTVGTFQPWKGYAVQNGTWQSTDLNGDGKGDLVHLVKSDYVHTWISNGDGSFTVGTFKPWQGYAIQNGTWQNADLNGDGKGDLVHLVKSDYVHTWISNGDGSFTVGTFKPWQGYAIQNGTWQNADLNGDGKGDLVHLVNSDYVHTWMSKN